jgi:hypothetical protein
MGYRRRKFQAKRHHRKKNQKKGRHPRGPDVSMFPAALAGGYL